MKLKVVTAALFALGLSGASFAQAPATAPSSPRAATQATASPAAAASGARVDINRATEQQLESALPGIGPVRAKAIVAGRPYAEPQELVGKKVLTQGVYDGLKDRIALANINASTAADMVKVLPGIGEVRAAAIVAGRPYATPNDLVTKGVLTAALYDRIKDLVAH